MKLLRMLSTGFMLPSNRLELNRMAANGTLEYQARANNADSRLDSMAALDIDSKPMGCRQTGIICTIGSWGKI